jgi:hypothetical protein
MSRNRTPGFGSGAGEDRVKLGQIPVFHAMAANATSCTMAG